MNAAAYELLSTSARYWFLALMALIMTRLILSVAREVRIERQVRREIDRAGADVSAVLEVVADETKRVRRGKRCLIVGETTVGRGRRCDLRVRSRSLRRVHCIVSRGPEGLEIVPVGRAAVVVDGVEATRRVTAHHGSKIQMGGLVFRLELEGCDEV